MNKIEDLPELMIEMLDNTDDSGEFSDRAKEIINEIADYAEKTKIFKDNKEKGETQFEGEPARLIYGYLCDRIVNAPTTIHRDVSCILIIPFLRKAIQTEGNK